MAAGIGKAATIAYEVGSVFTTIANVKEIGGPAAEVGTAETTYLGSSARTFIPTITDFGTCTFSGNYDPADATHVAMVALLGTPAVTNWKITYPNGTDTHTFGGILTKFEPTNIVVDDVIQFDAEIKISGAVTFG